METKRHTNLQVLKHKDQLKSLLKPEEFESKIHYLLKVKMISKTIKIKVTYSYKETIFLWHVLMTTQKLRALKNHFDLRGSSHCYIIAETR